MRQSLPKPSAGQVGRPAGAIRALLLLLVVVVWLAPMNVAAQTPVSTGPSVDPTLQQQANANPQQVFRVLVQRKDQTTTADDYFAASGYPKIADVSNVGFVARVPGKDIANLAQNPAVRSISLDAPVQATDHGDACTRPLGTCNLANLYAQAVGASGLWSEGVTGRRIGVAVVDSGVANLPDFRSSAGAGDGRLIAQVDLNSTTHDLADQFGHGTHLAGTIAGNSWWRHDQALQGQYVGVAPEANLIDVKVSDSQGMAYVSDVINGIDWVIAHRQADNIRVLNLSLQSTVPQSYLTSPFDAEVERAWFNGILVVASAGNGGPNSLFFPPANDPFVLTVGAADLMGTVSLSDDTVVSWSSYGTTQDGFAKPEVVAPGRYITAPLASSGATLAQDFPTQIVDGKYLTLSGTSMAAAVTSGIAALVFQAHPDWTNDQVKTVLGQTAEELGAASPAGGQVAPYPGQGHGEVNAQAAVAFRGSPSFANQGLTISSLLLGPNGATTYLNSTSSWSDSSWSDSSWSTSSWSTSSWSTSSWSDVAGSTSSWSDSATQPTPTR
jgi:serine protease AprX